MVYGLLDIFVGFDAQDPISQVDYTLPASAAFANVAIHIISTTGKLEVLYNAQSYGKSFAFGVASGHRTGRWYKDCPDTPAIVREYYRRYL
jgi:hypothetical protein